MPSLWQRAQEPRKPGSIVKGLGATRTCLRLCGCLILES